MDEINMGLLEWKPLHKKLCSVPKTTQAIPVIGTDSIAESVTAQLEEVYDEGQREGQLN